MNSRDLYREVWCVDTEYGRTSAGLPDPRALVAHEVHSGQTISVFEDDLRVMSAPPYPTDPGVLFCCYHAPAEVGFHLSMGWEVPARILDLCAEYKALLSGFPDKRHRLLDALEHFGIVGIDAGEKKDKVELILRGGSYTAAERAEILLYCRSDVVALVKLLHVMAPEIDLKFALLRGRYGASCAYVERRGIPLDAETLTRLRSSWPRLKSRLIREVDQAFGVFIPTTVPPRILREAEIQGVDPCELADVIEYLWGEYEGQREYETSVEAARKSSRLTPGRMAKWENSGKDYSSWPGLDVQAREIALEHPELGLGPEDDTGGGDTDTDYAANLWSLLRDGPLPKISRYDSSIVTRALSMCQPGGSTPSSDVPLSFNMERFDKWLAQRKIPWLRLESGKLDLKEKTFRDMARAYPDLWPLHELRVTLDQVEVRKLAMDADGRNRVMTGGFGGKTSRNAPRASEYVFGPATWVRSLIKPPAGEAVAYCDISAEEFGVAAYLSKDQNMIATYESGDPYLSFGKAAGLLPPDATKTTHRAERDMLKVAVLAIGYRIGPETLSLKIGRPVSFAADLIKQHRRQFPRFWSWSERLAFTCQLRGRIQTVYGWPLHWTRSTRLNTAANFPVQANAAEVLRVWVIKAVEAGVPVAGMVHDAVVLVAPENQIDAEVLRCQEYMREATRIILGAPLRSDAKVIRYPDRYVDPRGKEMWEKVQRILGEVDSLTPNHPSTLHPPTPLPT
jgi:hypothetical protein